jgi:hypothetical protein
MTPEPAIPTSVVPLLIAAVMALAGVVVYLFKRMEAKDAVRAQEREAWVIERTGWAVERARQERFQVELRAEYETKYHEVHKTLYEDAREHEDQARREYAENIEAVSQNVQAASDKVTQVLDKIYDRYISPRRPPH